MFLRASLALVKWGPICLSWWRHANIHSASIVFVFDRSLSFLATFVCLFSIVYYQVYDE